MAFNCSEMPLVLISRRHPLFFSPVSIALPALLERQDIA
jgi:hypothetical protein